MRSVRRAAQKTLNPAAANARAVAAPIPLLAPVTTATRVAMLEILPGDSPPGQPWPSTSDH